MYICWNEAAGVRPHTPPCLSHYCFLAFNSTTIRPKWWPRHTVTSCPHAPFLCWHLWWRASTPWVALQRYLPSLILFIRGWTAEIPFPSWNPSESRVHVEVVINQMDKITIQVTASTLAPDVEQDLALWLENVPPALLWYSPHAIQSGIPRHHMLEERRWAHQDRFMCMIWSERPRQKHTFISAKSVEG